MGSVAITLFDVRHRYTCGSVYAVGHEVGDTAESEDLFVRKQKKLHLRDHISASCAVRGCRQEGPMKQDDGGEIQQA